MSYTSCGYLAEVHPDVPPTESVAVQIQHLYIDLQACNDCGALVHDTQVHDTWHQTAGVRAHFGLI